MMSGLGAELQKAPSLQLPRHQLRRAISDVHVLPKHGPFHNHHLHNHRDRGDKEEKAAASNLSVNLIFDGLKSEGVTPNVSRSGSRRASVLASADDQSIMSGWQRNKNAVKPGEVKVERERSSLRATQLRKALSDLNTLANNTAHRLDDTYYSVLEKVNTLNDTITSLKELAASSSKLNDEFKRQSSEIVADATTQLDTFDSFRAQEQKIQQLESRIVTGRERSEALGQRIAIVKHRIEQWEKVEGEWQQRTRKTLWVLWSVTAITCLIVLGLMAFQYTPARTQGPGVLHGFNISNFTVNVSEIENRLENGTLRLKRAAVDVMEKLQKSLEEEADDDPRLKAFDDL